jgi:hypothetical protein
MGLLIAIATANVSNLIMVRGRRPRPRAGGAHRDGRERRAAVQAIPRRRLRPAAIGALLSVPASWTALQLLVSVEPVFRQIVIDEHELAFVASLALVCPVVFSLASCA